jgi:hypothetical protein
MEINELKEMIDSLDKDIGRLYSVKRQLEQEYWEKINKEYGGPITNSLQTNEENNIAFDDEWSGTLGD